MQETRKGEPLVRSDCDGLKSSLGNEERFSIYELLGFNGGIKTKEHQKK